MDDRLETDRLVLRSFRVADGPAVRGLANDWRIARMTAQIPHPYPEGLAETWIAGRAAARAKGTGYTFCIEHEGAIAGAVSINGRAGGAYELGYWLGQRWWGRGLATEAARRLVRHAFEDLGIGLLTSGHFTDNPASGRVLRKCGFREIGRGSLWCEARGRDVDLLLFELTREQAQQWPSEA